MLTFWNRAEVYFGNSKARHDEICEMLAQNHIQYTTRYKQTTHGYPVGRARNTPGAADLAHDWTRQYYIYVHRENKETAEFLIHRSEQR